MPFEYKTVYLNGQYLPLNEAKVSVMDRGFLFGDGIYEVIPSYSGKLFHFQHHMERLENSLSSIRLANPHSREQWLEILTPLLDASLDQSIYLQITRGVGSKRDHAFPENVTPTVFAMCSTIVPLENLESGVKALSVDDSRWELCNVKATTLLANILLRQQAVEKGCAEAILVKDGYVTEGAASNIFAVIDGVLITPPIGHEILPGITREVILQIARDNNIPYSEDIISLDALKTADEIWLTSSTREIVPIVELDNEAIANGKPGPIWKTMYQLFQAYKHSHHD
ncbi:MAG: D-amino acid aminotransferase [Methylobacter sp.]